MNPNVILPLFVVRAETSTFAWFNTPSPVFIQRGPRQFDQSNVGQRQGDSFYELRIHSTGKLRLILGAGAKASRQLLRFFWGRRRGIQEFLAKLLTQGFGCGTNNGNHQRMFHLTVTFVPGGASRLGG
jgi:hypothetical protein